MKCAEVARLLHAYVAGSLEPSLAEEVREHLGGCARCGEEVALEQAIARGLQEFPALEPSGLFARRTLERLAQARKPAGPPAPGNGLGRLILDGLVPALAAAVLLMWLGITGPRPTLRPTHDEIQSIMATLPAPPVDADRLLREAGVEGWASELPR